MKISRVLLQDCHKAGSESKLWAGFSSKTSERAFQPAVCLPANAVFVCLSTVGVGSLTKGLKFSILRGSPGRPALSAQFRECNGTFCMDALSRILIHLQQDHSYIHDSSSSLRNTYQSQRIDIHATGGIRTHNLSRRGAVDRPATAIGEISHLLIENEK